MIIKNYLKQSISIPISFIIWFLPIAILGWTLYAGAILERPLEGVIKTIIEFGFEILKALFLGFTAGFIISYYLKYTLHENPEVIPEESGIGKIYSTRLDTKDEFIDKVRSENIKEIYISGISLRDFLTGAGPLRPVWNAICDRLDEEKELPDSNRLKVYLLLLDPRSSEGHFRFSIEREQRAAGLNLPVDVRAGLDEVFQEMEKINSTSSQQFLQIKLYSHCPFSFTFATNMDIFVEQYYYQSLNSPLPAIPLIRYSNNTQQYKVLLNSVKKIWERAHEADLEDWRPKTAAGIEGAAIQHIFRRDQRDALLSKRQVECISNALSSGAKGAQPTMSILAASAKFYRTRREARLAILAKRDDGVVLGCRIAIANPVSQQAILRAIADSSPPDRIGDILKNWTWRKHRESDLYQDIHSTINAVDAFNSQGYGFELKLYSSSIICSILLTPHSAFVEQYLYGRSRKWKDGLVLGGEYPVFEFGHSKDKIEREVLQSHFDVVWKFFSISVEEYRAIDEEKAFENNFNRLLEELNLNVQS